MSRGRLPPCGVRQKVFSRVCGCVLITPRMSNDSQLTPMMAQYRRIKGELPQDALLLFRLGDFYELFFEDAQVGAQILNVALTKRGVIPMCGIPFHAANGYIARILRAGRKVAICDQDAR
jgi:DNA mismatch repair protein MutS